MPSKSKSKGDREERDVVNIHRELGLTVMRTLEAGARSDGSDTWDIDLYWRGKENTPLIGECKLRAKGFKQIYEWLGENDFLTIRSDRNERLYVVPESLWLNLMELTSKQHK